MELAEETESAQAGAVKVCIGSPRFVAFLAAQFLGTANESAFRMTLVLFVLTIVSDELRQVRYSSIATSLVPLAYLVVSPMAGYFADRFPKHRVLLWTKAPEIAVMLLATAGFYLRNLQFLYVVLFLIAARTAFFSPAKFGILPDVFEDAALSSANGILELVSDLAILIGSLLGVYVFSLFSADLTNAGLVFLAIACIGTLAVLFVPRAPAGNRQAQFAWNVFSSFRRDYVEVRSNPTLYYTLVGIAWFGFIASFFLTVVPVFGKNELGLNQTRVGLLFVLLSLGLGIGAVAAGRLSRGHVEIGLVPIGSVGITIFSFLLAGSGPGRQLPLVGLPAEGAIAIMLIGFSAGFFIIPLNSLLQQRAPAGMTGRLVAFGNVLQYGAILIAAGVPWILTSLFGLSIRRVIFFAALVTLCGTLYVVRRLPDFLVRLILWVLTNTIYRVRVVGEENQPKGGALLVGNHVSLIDSFIVSASTSRMVRYFCYRPYYDRKSVNWYFRLTHTIPLSDDDPKEAIEAALERAREVIRHGHVLALFAEGSMTRTGNMLKFRRGLERIAGPVNCPIVPMYLDGVWESIFSFERGRYVYKLPQRWWEPITVVYGKPMPSTSTAEEVRRAVQDLSTQTFENHKDRQKPIQVGFIEQAKRRWHATLAVDADGSSITFGAALARVIVLSQTLWERSDPPGTRVGILMPPGIDALLANFATLFAGHIPVNIDAFDVAQSVVARARIASVITTRAFAQTLGSRERLSPAVVKYFEDVEAATSAARRAQIQKICRVTRARSLARLFVRGSTTDVDQVATILFSYHADTPDTPRGVMLTHHNLLSNLESLRQVFRVTREDCILGLIPFSNSMSFSSTLLVPALAGVKVAFGAPLLGGAALGAFCRSNRVSVIAASPAILASMVDQVERAELADLRQVAVGGGELDDELRARFLDKFGIEPRQGYGCPECAPIISLNIPDYIVGVERQPGTRRGSAGQPVPGVSIRIVDPASGVPVAQGAEGMLLVKGPNVMSGYADDPELTRQVMRDGWYVTGDRATVDRDGFLTIAHEAAAPPVVQLVSSRS